MKILKGTIKYFSICILSLLIMISLYTIISVGLLKRSYTNIFGYSYFVIASGSMSPTIETNDIVIVKLNEAYEVGDIVTYKSGDSFVTHRVTSIENDSIVAKGDANNTEDQKIAKKDIIGKVVTIISSVFLIKILGIILILFLIVTVIDFDRIFSKYIKLEKYEKSEKPIEYTQVIPIIKDDNDIVNEILDETKSYESLDQIINQFKDFKFNNSDGIKKYENKKNNKKIIIDVLNVLKIHAKRSKLTTDGAIKLKYTYELACTTLKSPKKVNKIIDNPPFKELYNYDFDEIGFTSKIRNALYEMPIYTYFILMIYSIIYDNEFYYDAVFKTLKYRIKIEKDDNFINNNYKVDKCINLIENIASKCKNNSFELDKVKEMIELNKDL